jgi:hypothetical protein
MSWKRCGAGANTPLVKSSDIFAITRTVNAALARPALDHDNATLAFPIWGEFCLMIKEFTDCFGPRAIIKELIRLRKATARERHEAVYLARIRRLAEDLKMAVPEQVDHLLCPRRQWSPMMADRRTGLSRDIVNGMARWKLQSLTT